MDERAYVETLFGHQDEVCDIDCGARERCVTAGGRDGTARVWKIVVESKLVFNGGTLGDSWGPRCVGDSYEETANICDSLDDATIPVE